MNSVLVLVLGFVVAYVGYNFYAKYIDSKVMKADAKRATPAKMYMDGVEFMPTSKNVLFGYQFKSIAGAAPIIGPIIAVQWGWLPALTWILVGAFFMGWVHDYSSAMIAMRNEGASFGGLSHKFISARARVILLFHLFLSPPHCRGFRERGGEHRCFPEGGPHGLAFPYGGRRPGGPDDLPVAKGYYIDYGHYGRYRHARNMGGLCLHVR